MANEYYRKKKEKERERLAVDQRSILMGETDVNLSPSRGLNAASYNIPDLAQNLLDFGTLRARGKHRGWDVSCGIRSPV